MNKDEALRCLKESDRKVSMISHISASLEWDLETAMPRKGEEERGEQLAYLSKLIHEEKTSPSVMEAVNSLEGEDLPLYDKALYRIWEKEARTSAFLPASFVERLSLAINSAHGKWAEAREKSDYSIFSPYLSELITLEKEMACLIGDGSYSALLDLYEDGMSTSRIDPIFSDLKTSIHSIMDSIDASGVEDGFLYKSYDESSLHRFCMDLIDRIGFDRSRASVGITLHPFTTTLGRDDVRISTRYSDASLADPIFSIIHEMGHAFYELYSSLNPEIRGTGLSGGLYMGIHESQSRLWENLIGRSHAFWKFLYPDLVKAVPHLEDVSLDSFVKAINKPQSSGIRVNADELTYSLHIIMRYEIEKSLIDGNIRTEEIPDLWNELSHSIVRYDVRNDSEGVLQDSHWAGGSFGYFPSYAIGNIYSVMFYNRMVDDLGGKEAFDGYLSRGEYDNMISWLDRNIWNNGSVYTPDELVYRVTGSKIDAKPYKEYLFNKFTSLY